MCNWKFVQIQILNSEKFCMYTHKYTSIPGYVYTMYLHNVTAQFLLKMFKKLMIINCKCTTYYVLLQTQLVRTASFCLCVLPLPTFPPDPTTGYLFTLWIFFHRCLSFLPNPSSFRVGNIFSTI